jgi:hypothetical protein
MKEKTHTHLATAAIGFAPLSAEAALKGLKESAARKNQSLVPAKAESAKLVKLDLKPLTAYAKNIAHHGAFVLAYKIAAGLELNRLKDAYQIHAGRPVKGQEVYRWANLVWDATGKSEDTASRWMDLAAEYTAATPALQKLLGCRDGGKVLKFLQKATEGQTESQLRRHLNDLLPDEKPSEEQPGPAAKLADAKEEESDHGPGEEEAMAQAMALRYQEIGGELQAGLASEEYRRLPMPVIDALLDTSVQFSNALRAELESRKSGEKKPEKSK